VSELALIRIWIQSGNGAKHSSYYTRKHIQKYVYSIQLLWYMKIIDDVRPKHNLYMYSEQFDKTQWCVLLSSDRIWHFVQRVAVKPMKQS
jgi:hypothetical protein